VESVGNQTLIGRVVQNRPEGGGKTGCRALPPVILFQALPKGEKMDLIVRQAAEGGIAEIVPFASEFSTAKTGKTGGQKFNRWERIIREARQQSGSAAETEVRQPLTIDGLFSYWEEIKKLQPGALGLLFHHLPLANESLHGYLYIQPPAVVLAIGPEGGFSPAEAARFIAAGFKPFTIGDTIFRTETAALYAQAAVRILLLERDSWEAKRP
jgi:16S rRNA (uracil1498-N3)-methyltransferase